MLKSLAVGAVVLAVAGSGLVYAQQRDGVSGDPGTAQKRERVFSRPTAEDFAALTDARIAALKAGLRLTPEQEKNWPEVETAIRDLAKSRMERMTRRADERRERRETRQNVDLIERLRGRADTMSEQAAGLKRLADASEPLYRSLDEGQKRRLAMLSRNMGGDIRPMRGPGRPH